MKYVVARLADIPPGERKIVEVAKRSIGVFNVNGDLYALRNNCPHQGAPLCLGETWGVVEADTPGEYRYRNRGEVLTCPHHGWEFDIRTGQSVCDPQRLKTSGYAVDVESGQDLLEEQQAEASSIPGKVKGPFVAESIPVTIEDDYVVLDLP